jgi:hypothetical protein
MDMMIVLVYVLIVVVQCQSVAAMASAMGNRQMSSNDFSSIPLTTLNQASNLDLANLQVYQGFSITGINNQEFTGSSVSSAGDINNDGYDDMIIGAPNYPSGKHVGRAYVIYGGPTSNLININLTSLTSSQGFTITGINNQEFTGSSVSSAGDINNDGYDDMIIGAEDYPSGSGVGRAYVIYGGPTSNLININLTSLTSSQGFTITGINNQEFTGSSVSSAGDINNDGYDDMIVGAFGYASGSEVGRAYVIYGGPTSNLININLASLTPTQGFSITGINEYDITGSSVSHAGDINNDGYDDMIIGAEDYPSGSEVGRAYVIYGGPTSNLANINLASLTPTQGFSITGINNGEFTGSSVSSAGDINNDGYDDMIIGAPGYPSDNGVGIAYVIYGGPTSNLANINLTSLAPTQGFSITGINNQEFTGSSVSSAGDINNDGYDDMIIGAPYYPSESGVGRAYVIYGGPTSNLANINLASLTSSQGFTITGINIDEYTGSSVSSAGDINNDGYDDMIIGAPYYPSESGVGRAYVIYGSKIGYIVDAPTPHPTSQPTGQPFPQPTGQPSSEPTGQPTSQPSSQPSGQPTGQPSKAYVHNNYYSSSSQQANTILTSILSTVSSVASSVLLFLVPSFVLNYWGFRYKLIYDNTDKETLTMNEIGLYYDENTNQLKAIRKIFNRYEEFIINHGNTTDAIETTLFEHIKYQLSPKNIRYNYRLEDTQSGQFFRISVGSSPYKYIHSNMSFDRIAQIILENAIATEEDVFFYYGIDPNSPVTILGIDTTFRKKALFVFRLDAQFKKLLRFKIVMMQANKHDGISPSLYKSIKTEQSILSSRCLLISEENLLRNYLLVDPRIGPSFHRCGVKVYGELGSIQGFVYGMIDTYLRRGQILNQNKRIQSYDLVKIEDFLDDRKFFAMKVVEGAVVNPISSTAHRPTVGVDV